MAHHDQVPYRAQNPQEILELVQTLNAHGKGGRGKGLSVKKNTYTLPSGRKVDSWRMQDWDYKKPNLPTYARGLFTYQTLDGKQAIAVRGYDKFFNHGEVKKTEWKNVELNTKGPYELSVKENGCIIFISGLDDGSLLVCSKHSTGARPDLPVSHSAAGEKWVERHLTSVGKTKEELARRLHQLNVTAVAELCDDDFEEHVLEYAPDAAGLYLHGVNLNVPEFATYPGHHVDKFAEEWGFRKTMYVMENNIGHVKTFLEHVAETGNYDGRDTEGFVIRCQARESPNAPWEDWFFKYKFEEPYLMYRQWRECTKAIIAGKEPRYKKHKKVTEKYLIFARKQFAKQPGLAKLYNQNHGIIKMRDDFLTELGQKGSDIIRQEIESGEERPDAKDVQGNVILVPIATIGCGKTTVALALVKLFGWGHFQNDNVVGKGNRPQRFATAVCNGVVDSGVMIADRNNHQERERAQIIDDVSRVIPEARFVALHWVHDRGNYDQIRRVMQDRVLGRGDNHQTIQAASKDPAEIIGIMDGFMHRFQPIDTTKSPDDAFDLVIDLDVTASSRENLETVVTQISSRYPKLFTRMPSADELDAAIDSALDDYKPEVKQDLSRGGNRGPKNKQQQQNSSMSKPKQPKLEFFAVRLPNSRVKAILDAMFRDVDPETARFYNHLKETRRLQNEFHVTLIHKAASSQHTDSWSKLGRLHSEAWNKSIAGQLPNSDAPASEPELGRCKVQLERLVWDNRVMCFVARLQNEGDVKFETVNALAHITIGTAEPNIKPKESNDLLQKWLTVGSGGESGIMELMAKGSLILDGSVRGVLSR
ncbi:tRNA ligase [Pseudovirgaria hyperparasitica]|uniref:tRNA ligase n=1 Tax=Pseudovirgaria hyperparasitica TaxID=470096 RepID=A0A6A6WGX5_9PEZI|nr:tRNA ligase [Pseudovirgaria hyperparasitica]KAF2762058.1 tRNA ligase [Pseudovirgaria hyperparasitica]